MVNLEENTTNLKGAKKRVTLVDSRTITGTNVEIGKDIRDVT